MPIIGEGAFDFNMAIGYVPGLAHFAKQNSWQRVKLIHCLSRAAYNVFGGYHAFECVCSLKEQYAISFEPHGLLRFFNAGNLFLGFAYVLCIVALFGYRRLVSKGFTIEHYFFAGCVLRNEKCVLLEADKHLFPVAYINLHPAAFLLTDFFHDAFGLQMHGVFVAHLAGYVAGGNYVLRRKGRPKKLPLGRLLLGFSEAAYQQGKAAEESEWLHR